MVDSIVYRISLVEAATAQATTSQAAYANAQATADALKVTAQIDQNGVVAARIHVRDGLVALGKPAYIDNPDGTESVIEIGGADYLISPASDASRPLPATSP